MAAVANQGITEVSNASVNNIRYYASNDELKKFHENKAILEDMCRFGVEKLNMPFILGNTLLPNGTISKQLIYRSVDTTVKHSLDIHRDVIDTINKENKETLEKGIKENIEAFTKELPQGLFGNQRYYLSILGSHDEIKDYQSHPKSVLPSSSNHLVIQTLLSIPDHIHTFSEIEQYINNLSSAIPVSKLLLMTIVTHFLKVKFRATDYIMYLDSTSIRGNKQNGGIWKLVLSDRAYSNVSHHHDRIQLLPNRQHYVTFNSVLVM